MKDLQNKALIYDSNCPMCCWYTDKFIQIGALPQNGRISFNELEEKDRVHLDEFKSRHQIPLLDTVTGNVVYGIDGLTLILAQKFPLFEKILTNSFCKKMVQPLYNFISYNRRIIVPAKVIQNEQSDYSPDFHLGWRMSLIVVCLTLFYLLISGLSIQLNVFHLNLFLVYPVLHIAFILYITKEDWKQKLWNALGDFAVTNLSTAVLFTPLFLIIFFMPEMPDYFLVMVFILFQIRLMIHFAKRIENKNYLR